MKYSIIFIITGMLNLFAADYEVQIEFEKKPPSVGLLYMADDKSLSSAKGPIMDQKNKNFSYKMIVGTEGSEVTFKNSDSFEHNIFANNKKTGVNFDVGLIPSGGETKVKMDWGEGVVRIGCKIHPKMRAYVANISSKYHKVVEFDKKKKSYTIKFSAPGSLTKLKLWLPKYNDVEIDLSKGEGSTDIMKKKSVRGTLTVVKK